MQKCRFTFWTRNNAQEWSRQVLIDNANMLNATDAMKTHKKMKTMI